MRRFALAVTAILSLLAVAACARPMVWHKPGADDGARQAAIAACENSAGADTEREYRERQTYADDAGRLAQDTYSVNMAAYTKAKTHDRLFSRCMLSQGYRKAPAGR